MTIAPPLPVLVFPAAEGEPAVLSSFVVEEEHAGRLAIGMWMLLAFEVDAREQRLVRYDHSQRAVGLDNIDPLRCNLFEDDLFGCGESTQYRDREDGGEYAGIDGKEPLAIKGILHRKPPNLVSTARKCARPVPGKTVLKIDVAFIFIDHFG